MASFTCVVRSISGAHLARFVAQLGAPPKPQWLQDSAKVEIAKREEFESSNRKLNRHLSERDPVVTVPDDD